MSIDRRRVLAALLGAATLPVLAACATDDGAEGWGESADSDEDCDAGDLAENDPDCGYYDDSSKWHLYPWVVPGKGGKPPAGKRPVPPAGVKVTPPRTGGGTRTGGGSGSRTGGSRTGGSRTGGRR